MNFLAHHVVSIYPDNYYYTLGLTLPDILSLQNKKCKITEKNIRDKEEYFKEDEQMMLLFQGMKIHLELDRWFHNSDIFFNLMKKTSNILSNNSFPVHQMVEILFDIFIDKKDKKYAKSLIKIYGDSRMDELILRLKNIYAIDDILFDKLKHYISNGVFYETYLNDINLLDLLKKLAIRINRKEINIEIENAKNLINDVKIILEDDFNILYDNLKEYSLKIQIKLKK